MISDSTRHGPRSASQRLSRLSWWLRHPGGEPKLDVAGLHSHQDYRRHLRESAAEQARRHDIELALLSDKPVFWIPGYCHLCHGSSLFRIHYRRARVINGVRIPDWREGLSCKDCGLNNRVRASLHVFDLCCRPQAGDAIYITEQTTAIYRRLRQRYTNVTGSEYLADRVPLGQENAQGIRNESLTRLSFADGRFEHILSFDVFEHIPDFRRALKECHRCLRPGGHLLFSIPFIASAEETVIRARVLANGEIEHLLPPEYHADPVNTDGCLCYYHFGWSLLDDLRDAGFRSARALNYWSRDLGYLGSHQIIFLAEK